MNCFSMLLFSLVLNGVAFENRLYALTKDQLELERVVLVDSYA